MDNESGVPHSYSKDEFLEIVGAEESTPYDAGVRVDYAASVRQRLEANQTTLLVLLLMVFTIALLKWLNAPKPRPQLEYMHFIRFMSATNRLGEGRYASAYKAIDGNEQVVVVKRYRASTAPQHLDTIAELVRSGKWANCKSLLPILAVSSGPEHYGVIVDFLPETLQARIGRTRNIDMRSMAIWMAGTVSAAMFLHDNQLYHGNLCLDNIRINEETDGVRVGGFCAHKRVSQQLPLDVLAVALVWWSIAAWLDEFKETGYQPAGASFDKTKKKFKSEKLQPTGITPLEKLMAKCLRLNDEQPSLQSLYNWVKSNARQLPNLQVLPDSDEDGQPSSTDDET